MLTGWLSRRRERREAALSLYGAVVRQARSPAFYGVFGVDDTLDGRFDLIVLHAFLVLRRLRRQGDAAEALAQALLDLMFADFDRSLRELGVSDHSIGKRVKDMVKACYGRLAAYEQEFGPGADAGAALLRNVYRGDEARRAQAERLSAYLRRSAAAIEAQPLPQILAGEPAFVRAEEH